MYLHELPVEHRLRNTSLIDINAWYKNRNNQFREVFPNFGIAKCSYNDLTAVWTEGHLWESREVWDEDRIDVIGANGNEGLHYEI